MGAIHKKTLKTKRKNGGGFPGRIDGAFDKSTYLAQDVFDEEGKMTCINSEGKEIIPPRRRLG